MIAYRAEFFFCIERVNNLMCLRVCNYIQVKNLAVSCCSRESLITSELRGRANVIRDGDPFYNALVDLLLIRVFCEFSLFSDIKLNLFLFKTV